MPNARRRGRHPEWGLLGCQKEVAFAADRVVVVVEELVDEDVIRADPNRTIIPGSSSMPSSSSRGARIPRTSGRVRPRQPLLPRLDPITARRGAGQAWLADWV
jgi:glutaconate CoA-transferase subunit A